MRLLRDDTFWRSFLNANWEKEPVVFRGVLGDLPVPFGEWRHVLESLVRPGGGERSSVTAFVGRFGLLNAVDFHSMYSAICAADSLANGIGAASKAFDNQPVGLQISRLESAQTSFWPACHRIASAIVDTLGLPASRMHLAAFIGNYPSTPFGIHRDEVGVLTCCVEGSKRMLLWPGDYFERRKAPMLRESPLAQDVRRYEDDAIVLAAQPGDVMYWPSSYWHVAAELDDHVHATLSIGCWLKNDVVEDVMNVLKAAAAQRFGPARSYRGVWPNSPDVPQQVRHAIEVVTSLVDDGEFERCVVSNWASRFHNAGFRTMPASSDVMKTL